VIHSCRRLIRPVLALALLCVAAAAARAADLPYVQHMNVVYAETDGIGLLMDIFTPTAKSNGLALVDVASGAWHSDRGKINDHKRAQMYDIFCGRGYTVFAVRPGSRTKFCAPEMLSNLNQAIRWVKVHDKQYNIDRARLGLCGASAGGHLASLAAVTAIDDDGGKPGTRVKAVAVFFPPTDFTNWGGVKVTPEDASRISKTVAGILFPGGITTQTNAEIFARIEKISPAKQVTSHCPPFLIYHGDADPLVPLQQSQVFVEALKNCGVSAELIVKPGGGHPWPTIHEEVAKMADWFDAKLPGE
jgi:acetyl esterase/lipase